MEASLFWAWHCTNLRGFNMRVLLKFVASSVG